MWVFLVLLFSTSLLSRVVACGDQHGHVHAPRQSRPFVSQPTTPLVWGDINILHTTDSHGWLGGHTKSSPPEPNYSGDLGTFSSFVTHMKKEAESRNVDLLLVDSGDLHDGNGLTDGFANGGVDGHEALKVFAKLPYDILAIGNHELYQYNVTYDVHKHFVPKWNGRYLSSNVNITLQVEDGHTVSVPVGDRFAKFKTRLGRSVTALGVLFDFAGNSANTTVQPVEEMVKEAWFKDAIADEPHVFILAGHMPVQKDNWPIVFNAIRAVHPLTPILILGGVCWDVKGHAHIRDCVQLDGRSMALASGRYMETIGWMSAKLDEAGSTEDIAFSRRYLDANPVTYSFHTGKNGADFDTAQGQSISTSIHTLSDKFNLTYRFGVAPQDYFMERAPYGSNQSLLTLLASQVLPTALSTGNPRASIPKIFVTNSGAMRYDLLAGNFTRNDEFVVSPFVNTFQYIANISSTVARRVLDELNKSGLPARKRDLVDRTNVQKRFNMDDVNDMYRLWMREQWEAWNLEQRDGGNLTLGYVTKDACPGIGDDVSHTPLPHYTLPPFIGSPPPSVPSGEDNTIDIIFADFIRDDVIQIVNTINAGSKPNVSQADVQPYSDLLIDQVLGVYAQEAWN